MSYLLFADDVLCSLKAMSHHSEKLLKRVVHDT